MLCLQPPAHCYNFISDASCRYAAGDALRACGGSVLEMLQGQYSHAELRSCCVTAAAMRACGCSAAQLKAAGFSLRELKIGGYNAAELKETGCACFIGACECSSSSSSSSNALLQVHLLRAGGCRFRSARAAAGGVGCSRHQAQRLLRARHEGGWVYRC